MASLVAVTAAAAALGTNGIVYPPINVWPYPKTVDLSAAALGPHAMAAAPAIKADGCPGGITELARAVLAKRVEVRVTARSYDEKPYVGADGYCPSSLRCSADSDCAAGRCVTKHSRRWNSTHACPPSSPYNAPCGCCSSAKGLPVIPSLTIQCGTAANDESYSLNVTAAAVSVSAPAPAGAAHALATLAQLLRWDPALSASVADRVPLSIHDAPTYPWRGLMLDTSRNFVPVDQILTLIDGLFAAKLNVFHWHIVDSPSFPYQSAAYPELANEGAWSQDNRTIYTQADVKAVVDRAAARFVELVMEFDTPAHTMAWGRSHPEIMSGCWDWMANQNPKVDVDSDDCMAMDPTAPAAQTLVTGLLKEVAGLIGDNQYVHLGGDEVRTGCWNSSSSIQSHVLKKYGDLSDVSFRKLQADWTKDIAAAAVTPASKTPVLWQPTAAGPKDPAWNPATVGLPKETVYMSWLNAASVTAYAKAGARVVTTNGFYVAGMGSGGWKNVYNTAVMPSGLSAAEQKLVLGGQVCLWGETMGAGNLDVRAWQIGAGAAENFWGKVENPPWEGGWALQDRFNRFLCYVQSWGVSATPQMPSFCGVY
eukprot:TRINITY_DN39495_c0_g1_i1.p1 TRINITY_DN39495_c0_g1~~TRINITY_DN39495_c0_g1_i1.p1  ORF type:complete len:613 (+),score=186.17 TRINITY_DN39495_c0_g1_i1:59-1840(+)